MATLKKVFKSFEIELSSECRDALLKCSFLNLRKGSYLLKEDTMSKNIGFLISGKIIHYYNINGKQIIKSTSSKNTIVTGLTSFINNSQSTENLLCVEDSKIAMYTKEYFTNTLLNFTEIQNIWIKTLQDNLIKSEYLLIKNAEKHYANSQKEPSKFLAPEKYTTSILEKTIQFFKT